MVALGSKCLVGDQLHPDGAINPDTYASIAPGLRADRKARALSRRRAAGLRHRHPDGRVLPPDGARGTTQRRRRGPDAAGAEAAVRRHRSERRSSRPTSSSSCPTRSRSMPSSPRASRPIVAGRRQAAPHRQLGDQCRRHVRRRRRASSGRGPGGVQPVLHPRQPRPRCRRHRDARSSSTAVAETIAAEGAEVLAEVIPSYFNRTFQHFSSHQHTPDDPKAKPLGAAVTINGAVGYIAYPIFRMYHAMGQPLYRYLVRGLHRPAAARSGDQDRSAVLGARHADPAGRAEAPHPPPALWCAAGPRQGACRPMTGTRVMEMIEDIPDHRPASRQASACRRPPTRVYDALTGADVPFTSGGNPRSR